MITKSKLVAFALLSFGELLASNAKAQCDRDKETWLDEKCQMPNLYNPNHACRYTAYMKANNIDPNDPKFGRFTINGEIISTFRSVESMAVETCEAAKQIRCTESQRLLIEDYTNIQKAFIEAQSADKKAFVDFDPKSPDNIDVNINKNFTVISDANKSILQSIDTISQKMPSIVAGVNSTEQLRDADSNLVKDFVALRPAFVSLSDREASFNVLLSSLMRQVAYIAERSLALSHGYKCDFGPTSAIQKYSDDLKELVALVNEMQSEVKEASAQREKLLNETYFKWKYAVYKHFADFQGIQIDKVLDGLNRDVLLDKILWKVADWWTTISVNGLAGRLHTKYYYYSEPLRILRSQKEQGQKFKAQISAIQGLDQVVTSTALKTVDDKIANINSGIAFIESKGWSGLLTLQKAAAANKAALLPTNQVCQDRVKAFLTAAATVNSVETFDNASPLFRVVVDKCVKQ